MVLDVNLVLDMATENSDNPDLRDRGYVYWRLLSTDPAVAKSVVRILYITIPLSTFFERRALDMMVSLICRLAFPGRHQSVARSVGGCISITSSPFRAHCVVIVRRICYQYNDMIVSSSSVCYARSNGCEMQVLVEKPVISGDTHVLKKPFLNTMFFFTDRSLLFLGVYAMNAVIYY